MITDQQELESEVRDAMETRGARVLAIDGIDGSGKTTLSEALAPKFGCAVLHLDNFVEKKMGGFLDYIDYKKLSAEIQTANGDFDCVVIEGVCVLEVLDQIQVKPDLHIYIKEMTMGFGWHKKSHIYGDAESSEEKIALEEERNRLWSEMETTRETATHDDHAISGLRQDIIKYHWRFRPDEKADIVFGITKSD